MCPRCAHESISKLAGSPVAGAWEVLQCQRCLYTWRTTEPDRRTKRDSYPEAFKMTQADIDNAPEVPAIPALRGRG
ncbi:non-oxidative hydroxyarylic acid decarboxylases subunit D [Halosaccharopolyspora lacisalsi]|uniref:non-oxidative hydroxyarylic acid decarboxylases subunit D n=1 Tax=Halosaccharopolyspora lacisalsi TaxID=1000566 RepID=UPI0015F9EF06|nr:non-oxidative hydroxyarylic acid decarboxylases subunit D [Halosaccharopolyspora lacisalsi]